MATKIGPQHGITAYVEWLRKQPNAPQRGPGYKPDDVSTWPWPDKLERTLGILAADHDSAMSSPTPTPPEPEPPADYLAVVEARLFLAQEPLVALRAPSWMVPVCTADLGYRHYYTPEVIDELRDYFGLVEAWCDCRESDGNPPGTPYSTARAMVDELGLDGEAWGQCESTAEFDHAYAGGASRMVGLINAAVLDADRLELVARGEVLLTVELYCNKDRNLEPDYRNANDGVGGNTIACYESPPPPAGEGAVYTPVEWYRERGYYVPGRDSVYAVGLTDDDWRALA